MSGESLRVAGLFAGIGGIEEGLHRAGHQTELLCEIEPAAIAVLRAQFPGVRLSKDVRRLGSIGNVDLVAAGFPCQDLSQAGLTAGISGRQSGLVEEVFKLVTRRRSPRWLLLENVPFMLQLDRGKAMSFLTTSLAERGFAWAYRVVDARAFGIPQRRRRVILLASRSEDPRPVLFSDNAAVRPDPDWRDVACGFYWTEGVRGLGWAVDAVPTLKGGSTVGIPSPPAIHLPDGRIVTPDLRDAERLQGFDPGWTEPATTVTQRLGARWKLVGNAVSVPVAEWLGRRLRDPDGAYDDSADVAMSGGAKWPAAAWGKDGKAFAVPSASSWPVRRRYRHLAEFLRFPPADLSIRATAGFLGRAKSGRLRFPEGFLADVEQHLRRMERGDRAIAG